MFQLSLVLYLSQVYLQALSKVSRSQSSGGLWLCPSRHLGPSAILHSFCKLLCHFYIYSYVYTVFAPTPTLGQNLFHHFVLYFVEEKT
jgi:hypothetical protein